MITLANYWVQKRYQTLPDRKWMLFLWGFQASSMLAALNIATRKAHTLLEIKQTSDKFWEAYDKEMEYRYVIERRDTKPDLEASSVRDQTIPVHPTLKRMPEPGSLFK